MANVPPVGNDFISVSVPHRSFQDFDNIVSAHGGKIADATVDGHGGTYSVSVPEHTTRDLSRALKKAELTL